MVRKKLDIGHLENGGALTIDQLALAESLGLDINRLREGSRRDIHRALDEGQAREHKSPEWYKANFPPGCKISIKGRKYQLEKYIGSGLLTRVILRPIQKDKKLQRSMNVLRNAVLTSDT